MIDWQRVIVGVVLWLCLFVIGSVIARVADRIPEATKFLQYVVALIFMFELVLFIYGLLEGTYYVVSGRTI